MLKASCAAVIRHYAQCCSSGAVHPCQIRQPTHSVTRPFQGERLKTPWAGAARWVQDTHNKPKKKPPSKSKRNASPTRTSLPQIGRADWHEINSTSLIRHRTSLSIRRWDYWYSNQDIFPIQTCLLGQTLPLEPSQSSWNPSCLVLTIVFFSLLFICPFKSTPGITKHFKTKGIVRSTLLAAINDTLKRTWSSAVDSPGRTEREALVKQFFFLVGLLWKEREREKNRVAFFPTWSTWERRWQQCAAAERLPVLKRIYTKTRQKERTTTCLFFSLSLAFFMIFM